MRTWVLVATGVVMASPVFGADNRLGVQVEPGVAVMLGEPQSDLFGTGAGIGLRGEMEVARGLAAQLAGEFLRFPSDTLGRAGRVWALGVGPRVRLMRALQMAGGGALLEDIWLGGSLRLIGTGKLTRFGFDVGAGVDLAISDGIITLGPFVRYSQVVQSVERGRSDDDAHMLIAGIGIGAALLRQQHDEPIVAEVPSDDPDDDGLLNQVDRCPDEPGPIANEGCPDRDSDGDGVLDRFDKCPDEHGPVQYLGCPRPPGITGREIDTDSDGYVDRVDQCPTEPEVFNGLDDDDGCPDEGPALVILTEDRIEVLQQVQFEEQVRFGSAHWKVTPASYPLLATVAKLLFLHPEIEHLQIQGHTDNQGSREYNQKLSLQRADAVMQHLIELNGINGARLSTAGYGFDRPIATNETDEGRAKNRRVEFIIIKRRQK